MISGKELRVIESMIRDIKFDVSQVQQYLDNKGGLTVEAFIERVGLKAKDLKALINKEYELDE